MQRKGILRVFVGLLLILAVLGCGSNQYAIERKFWQVQKQAEKIFNNPHASPPRELARIVNLLNDFTKNYPNTNLAVNAEFNIANLYMVKEEYDNARAQLQSIINKYRQSEPICAEATFLIGNSYQAHDKWDLALQQYKGIMQEYPRTPRGLDIPIYIAKYYEKKYQPDKMIAAYQDAIAHYKALSDKYPDSPFALNVDTLVGQCYIALKDWQNAINTFNGMLENYKGKTNLDAVMLDMAIIYQKGLKEKVKAKEILERLIQDYPKSKLTKTATAMLKELTKNE
jgi:TolA-binding protein